MFAFRSRSFYVASISTLAVAYTIGLLFLHRPGMTGQKTIEAAPTSRAGDSQAIAVVELFTSEGCSSCPSADENLKRIGEEKLGSDRNVYLLSYHVDYWNRLGWNDPFSNAKFTKRQGDYARVLKNDSVYTPQMIVNGKIEFVGSNRKFSDLVIDRALEQPAKHAVTLSVSPDRQGAPVLRYKVATTSPAAETGTGLLLNIAIVSDKETVSVPRGENAGQKLTHVCVVKSLDVVPLTSDDGIFKIDPSVVKRGHSRVIAYVQSKSTMEISGAASLSL